MSDSTAQTPATPQITEEMIEAGAMTLDERIPWDQHTPTGRAFMRLQAAAVLKAALAGRTVVETGSVASMVREFHEAFDLPIGDTTRTHNELRAELIREEAKETADAVEFEPLPQIAKELADLVIVTYGAALTMGIDLDRAVALVHASNMSKLGDDGRPVMRGDGKVLKGPNYRAPDMSPALVSESSGDSES